MENPVHVHDLQATILYLTGRDHETLTYRYQGRDFRLTDIDGHVVGDILAWSLAIPFSRPSSRVSTIRESFTMQTVRLLLVAIFLSICTGAVAISAEGKPAEGKSAAGKSRAFRLRYGATLRDLGDFHQVRVWLPVPASGGDQQVTMVGASLRGERYQVNRGRKFGNSILYFEMDPAQEEQSFYVDYTIERKESQPLRAGKDVEPVVTLSAKDRRLYLGESRLVPTTGRPLQLLPAFSGDLSNLQQAKLLYDCVDRHVAYDKSKPGFGNGDVLWVCDSGRGNCTDFHSLFIALARSQSIPARFEIGFPLPPERGVGTITGYHCWALFFDDQCGWVPVDISEADKNPHLKDYYFGSLTENRVTFSTGRDIILEPRQAGLPLNYFIYPYAEADGEILGENYLNFECTYEDLK